MKLNKYLFLILPVLYSASILYGQQQVIKPGHISLPGFFSNNMVLQRDKPVKFWGTATPLASFSIQFAGENKAIIAGKDGRWEISFPPKKAGGGYDLSIISDSSFSYKNILMGDVWIASGQSNMEFAFGNTDSVATDMAENENIRVYSTPTYISNYPQTDMRKADWQLCVKDNIPSFSAVAYFFAQKINHETGVPIGIIQSYWGGTSIKAWISEKGIAAIPEYKLLLDSFISRRNTSVAIDSINARNAATASINNKKIMAADRGYQRQWPKGNINTEGWDKIELPGNWQTDKLKDFDGVLWFTREIELPADVKDERFYIQFGRTLGLTELYINGVKAGTGNYFRSDNRYMLKPNTLAPGKNTLVIRLVEKDPAAAFLAKPADMVIQSLNANHPLQFSIAGQWFFTSSLTNKEIDAMCVKMEPALPNTTVSSIFNVKINPLAPLAVKGFLWYQGENDVAVAFFYRTLFQQMIKDWRQQFKQGDLPFIFAQLPCFGKIKNEPAEQSEWAEIRESQATALSMPNTAMAITLDVGNPADIHPHNKKPVGERMANAALDFVYQKKDVPLAPMLKSFSVQNNEVHIWLKNAGNGLAANNNAAIKGFAIAGANKKFVWAKATVAGKDELIVSSDSVMHPQFVRYAWASSPVEANLINTAGVPAAPFRTDEWPLTTQGKIDNH